MKADPFTGFFTRSPSGVANTWALTMPSVAPKYTGITIGALSQSFTSGGNLAPHLQSLLGMVRSHGSQIAPPHDSKFRMWTP